MRDPNSSKVNFIVIRTLTGHSGSVVCLAFVSDHELISGSIDKTIRIWNKDNEQHWKLM